MNLRVLAQLKNIYGKRVLVRIDGNVPIKNGKILDDYKLIKTVPTIQYLLRKGAKIIITSHLGRPNGYDKKLSLKPIVAYLEKKLRQHIFFPNYSVDAFAKNKHSLEMWQRIESAIQELKSGSILMLENIRFDNDEEKNTGVLAQKLANLADVFVLDGFGVAHREGASITGVADFLPTYAGFLLEEEVRALSKVAERPRHPLVLVLGGAKMETKIPLIKKFIDRADYILLGGGIVATYLHHQGFGVGTSLIEQDVPPKIFALFKNKKIIMPIDAVVGTVKGKRVSIMDMPQSLFKKEKKEVKFNIPPGCGIYDIGSKTLQMYNSILRQAQSIIWNGPLGYFEQKPYNQGTEMLIEAIVRETKRGAFSVCGGGETQEFLRKKKYDSKISLVSTGGGAMLEFLSGKKLPGVEVVLKK
jgi:3-phosphoglycerate kinase